MEGRFGFPAGELRTRTVRGVALSVGALVLFDGLVLLQGLIVTRLLGPRDIGLYGIVSVTLLSILMLKRLGIDEAFVQQDEAEQESEFQRAFTLELSLSAVFSVVLCLTAPILVLQGDDDQVVPYRDAALLQAKLLKTSTLKVYPGFPHGMCTTNAEVINADLLAFIRG